MISEGNDGDQAKFWLGTQLKHPVDHETCQRIPRLVCIVISFFDLIETEFQGGDPQVALAPPFEPVGAPPFAVSCAALNRPLIIQFCPLFHLSFVCYSEGVFLPPTRLTYLLVSDIFSYFWRFQLSWVIWSLECRPRARGFRLVVASSPLSAFHWYYYYFPLAKDVIRALLDNAWALIISNLRYDINYKRSKLILSDVRWASEWAGNTWPKTYNRPLSVPDGH